MYVRHNSRFKLHRNNSKKRYSPHATTQKLFIDTMMIYSRNSIIYSVVVVVAVVVVDRQLVNAFGVVRSSLPSTTSVIDTALEARVLGGRKSMPQLQRSFSFLESTTTVDEEEQATSTVSLSSSSTATSESIATTSSSTATVTATTTGVEGEEGEEINPRLAGLAFALDDGTRKSHSMAENTAFVQGFFKGLSSRDSYKQLLTSLYYIYQAMEEDVLDTCASNNDDVDTSSISFQINKLDDAPLRRLAGLEQDMAYFYGSDWKTQIAKPTPATKAYVARIHEIATQGVINDQFYLFIAHQYTRYLGDLFGGQMMGGMASRSMDLPTDGSGVAFYTFDNIPSTKSFITDWYTRLNDIALDLSPTEIQDIVDEANLVFALNIDLFQELEGSPWTAVWSLLKSGVHDYFIKSRSNKGGATTTTTTTTTIV